MRVSFLLLPCFLVIASISVFVSFAGNQVNLPCDIHECVQTCPNGPPFAPCRSACLSFCGSNVPPTFLGKEVNPSHDYEECLQWCSRDQGYFGYLYCQARCALVPWERPEQEQPSEQQGSEEEQGEGGRGQQQQGQQEQENPYHFPSHRFQTFYRSELGYVRALPRFDRYNRFLRGLQNYRILEFQSRPQTFFVPHHSNAHYLFIIIRGRALFTIVNANNRESYNLKRADVLAVPAGATVYVANRDNSRNLRVVQLAIPVTNPYQFQFFYPGGQPNPQSYYDGFSRQTLEAAFNAPYQEIQRALLGQQGQQQQGLIVRASWEQIRELTQQAKSSQEGSQGQSQSGPFNLENYELPVSNDYGRVWETRPNQTPQLRNLGVSSVGCAQLKQEALLLPHFNTEYTVIYVVEGNGTFEMACPHLSSQGQEEEQWGAGQIQSLTAEVSEGDVYVIPAFHPVALRASNKRNLHFVSFGMNDENSQITFLAGAEDNLLNQIDSAAKELTFSGSAEQVERILRKQRESHIVNGQPQQQQQQQGEEM